MKLSDFNAVQALMDKLQYSKRMCTLTTQSYDDKERSVTIKDLTQSEKERLVSLLKVFGRERINAIKYQLKDYGVIDDEI